MARKKRDAVDIAAEQRAREQAEVEQAFLTGVRTLRDFIAPSSIELSSGHFRLGTKYGRTFVIRNKHTKHKTSVTSLSFVFSIFIKNSFHSSY